jgi:prepilin-type N-terminal cleavage/methylation domain-containing protein
MNKHFVKSSCGISLIEILIALVISAILIAGIYRMFIRHQKTYITQEQVADMQQNVRIAINKMIREIRMAGFGGKNNNLDGENDIIKGFVNVNGFLNIINPSNEVVVDGIVHDQITVAGAYDQVGTLAASSSRGSNTITVTYADNDQRCDNPREIYLCLNGRDNYRIQPTSENQISLADKGSLKEDHVRGEPVFLVKAITYGLRKDPHGVWVLFRDENTGGDRQTVAEHIENLQFRYVLADGKEMDMPPNPKEIRGIRMTITARTQMEDPEVMGEDRFRRRTLTTYVDLRNMRDP